MHSQKETQMLECIKHDEQILAMILKNDFHSSGIEFFTPNNFSQQLGYMNRSEGYNIPPHVHNPVTREVSFTKEVLIIKKGKVRVDFYDEAQRYLESRILTKGDIVLLAFGGHGFKMLEQSEIVEIKQGPYAGAADKTRFTSVADTDIRFSKEIL